MTKRCDNKSVGVIIQNTEGQLALLRRAKFPIGIAPVAGHVDDHGSPEQAAYDEVYEELGLTIAKAGLRRTIIDERRVNNLCSRKGGDHHIWTVFEADQFTGDITPDPEETEGARWYSYDEVQRLADRTKAFEAGRVDEADWDANPGLEVIWRRFLIELGYVE